MKPTDTSEKGLESIIVANKAQKKLRRYVESHEHAIREKAEIMVDHFHAQVIGHRKIGGHARAMVITNGIERAIQYFHAFRDYLKERKSPYAPIVAFSGEHEYGGKKVTEATLNGFPSSQIPDKVQQVRGSLGAHEQGLIITTSDFSAGAVKEAAQADKTPIALMNGEQLVMLLMEHGIGVHRSTPDLFEIDEEFGPVMK